jgi:hypothetical protein
MSRFLGLTAATLGMLAVQGLPGAMAQDQPFVAHANVMVANNTPVPQTVGGTNVMPFELMPHQQAELDMSTTPPPAPTAPGNNVPVRFEFSVGQGDGPKCHGSIDMSLNTQPSANGNYVVTNCVAHSSATDGANCRVAVSAKNEACQGGLAFATQ